MPKPQIIVLSLIVAIFAAACGSDGGAATTIEATPETTAAAAQGGFMVQDGDAVEVHYTGTLEDGTEFIFCRQPFQYFHGAKVYK